jgi:hypothetical protein
VRLAGWTSKRRIIILRRPLREDLVVAKRKGKGRRRKAQMELEMGWVQEGTVLYENAVLVTSLQDEIFALAVWAKNSILLKTRVFSRPL